MFKTVGRAVARHSRICLLLWIIAGVAAGVATPSRETLLQREPGSILPADQPYNIALDLARDAFPETAARTRTILIFERPSGLTQADRASIARIGSSLIAGSASRWRVLSAATHPFLTSRLVSDDRQAAMIVLNHDVNYITPTCVAHVEEIEARARNLLPAGLTMEITGEGGLGKDLSRATAEAYHRTTWVTVLAVLTILVLVYRAPLAALVPLFSIGMSVYVALRILDLLALSGCDIGDLERTFTVILLFGSGTDFSMFWMSRYREELAGHRRSDARSTTAGPSAGDSGATRREALVAATVGTGPAITASAATTIAGLSMLLFADLSPTHNAGRTLGLALAVSMVAALTLTPTLAGLMGGVLFWPGRATNLSNMAPSFVWDRVARAVVRRPGVVLVAAILLLAWPVQRGRQIRYRYDAFGVVPSDSSAARGQAIAERHFSADELFSWTMLVRLPSAASRVEAADLARDLGEQCRGIEGVSDVWSLDAPLGGHPRGSVSHSLAGAVVRGYYVSDSPPCIRAEIMQPVPPLSPEAMDLCHRVLRHIRTWAGTRLGDQTVVHSIGLTPYIMNVRDVSEADQRRIMALVVAAIAALVLVWIRRPVLTVCMVAATLGLYFATLGVADIVFGLTSGAATLDWKVKLFLFVIMMAVGQDYNIFLVSRLFQERREANANEATRRAILTTGRVISSCGLIMAATLGSIATTGLPFYRQLGFAFAFGILLDTFVIRPAVLPACYLLREALRRIPQPRA